MELVGQSQWAFKSNRDGHRFNSKRIEIFMILTQWTYWFEWLHHRMPILISIPVSELIRSPSFEGLGEGSIVVWKLFNEWFWFVIWFDLIWFDDICFDFWFDIIQNYKHCSNDCTPIHATKSMASITFPTHSLVQLSQSHVLQWNGALLSISWKSPRVALLGWWCWCGW